MAQIDYGLEKVRFSFSVLQRKENFMKTTFLLAVGLIVLAAKPSWAHQEHPATDSNSEAKPFDGYYFQLLTKQGEHAAGRVQNYIVDGKMTRGFAFLAYPVEYAISGVMSFIIDQEGIVYQKDLGPNTSNLAKTL